MSSLSSVVFVGKESDFSNKNLSASALAFAEKLKLDHVCLLNQIHTDNIVPISASEFNNYPDLIDLRHTGDGFILNKEDYTNSNKSILFGIRTADCLPIFIETDRSVLLLHAGWRSLSMGILEKALTLVQKEEIRCFAIGPAASKEMYEVGKEVIASFKEPKYSEFPQFDFKSKKNICSKGGYYLDLKQTALKVFEKNCVLRSSDCVVDISNICTISDLNWHSHRREGDSRGSNLMFCKMPF